MFPARGLTLFRANWEQRFADPSFVLTWTAEKVVVTRSGTMAYTTGTWRNGDAHEDLRGPDVTIGGLQRVVRQGVQGGENSVSAL